MGIVAMLGVLLIMRASARPQLGVRDGRLLPLPSSPNGVSSQADDPGQRTEPLPLLSSPQATLDRVESVVRQMGGKVVQRTDNYLHAEFRTAIMRYVDDVEFLLADDALHLRSASRVGYWDLGVNRRRMSRFRSLYEQP